jgi:flagellar basal-body rod protein FlgB
MSLDQIPVFGVLRGSMHMLTERQKLLAENIANADTPGFTPRDVDQKSFQKALASAVGGRSSHALGLKTSNSKHFQAHGASSGALGAVAIKNAPNSETTLNGNSVVLEEQVASLADTRMRYETAVGLYQKSLSLIRLALKSPGT